MPPATVATDDDDRNGKDNKYEEDIG